MLNNQTESTNTEEAKKEKTLQDIELQVFGPESLDKAQTAIEEVLAICEKANIEPMFNFDPEESLPEEYGLSVIPLSQRVPGQGNVTQGICVAAIPTLENLVNTDTGVSFINKLVQSTLIRNVKVAAMPKDEDSMIELPFSIMDFTTTSRSSALAAFNLLASAFVKALKDKGLKFMNKPILRQTLSTAEFAEQQFPNVAQESWQAVLNSMIDHAKAESVDPGILNHWLKTRDTIKIDTSEIDLSDINNLIGDDDDEDSAEAEPEVS